MDGAARRDEARQGTHVVCLGNEFARDDGAGIRVGRALQELGLPAGVTLHFHQELGLELLDLLVEAERLVLVDATSPAGTPGRVGRCGGDELRARQAEVACCHGFGLAQMVALVEALHPEGPLAEVVLVGIEAESFDGFDLSLTPRVAAAIPTAVEAVLGECGGGTLGGVQRAAALRIASEVPWAGEARGC